MISRVITSPALLVERVIVEPRLRLRGHGHDSGHLCFVLAGEFRERGTRETRAVADTLRLSPPGDEHDITFGATGGECLVIELHGAMPASVRTRTFLTSPLASRAARAIATMLQQTRPSPLEIELQVLELLACGLRGPQRRSVQPPRWVERVRERLADGSVAEISSAALAEETGYHGVYVARAFRQWYGCGPGDFMRTLRVERARTLLLSGVPAARVAAQTGFSDQSHLTRELRRRLGCTPRTVAAHQVASFQEVTAAIA